MELQITEIAARTGLELSVVRSLAGGEQGGAHLVTAAGHGPLVLKCQPDPDRARSLVRALPLVNEAVARGWPGAAWLHGGLLDDGSAFVLQQHVPGRTVTTLDATTVRAVVDANSRQSGLAIPGAPDDSVQLAAVLRGEHPWRRVVLDRSPTGRTLVDHGAEVIRWLGRVRLPVSDLVHGDYSATNMIRSPDGAITFVDAETVGRGTRVRDLADLYRSTFVHPGTDPATVQELRDAACAIAGPEVFATCVVATSYNNLAWWAHQRTTAEFDRACRRVHGLFAGLRTP